MKINLVSKIRDFARLFKVNEETYVIKYKELVGDVSPKNEKREGIKEDFLQTTDDFTNSILRQRDDEINTLVKSITELAGIFKDMQTLVIEQG
jgi:hypothetical protein